MMDDGRVGLPPSKRLRLDRGSSSPLASPHSCDYQPCHEPEPSNLIAPPSPSLSAEVFNGGDVCTEELQSHMAMEVAAAIITPADLDSNLVMEIGDTTSIDLDEGHLVMGELRADFSEGQLAEDVTGVQGTEENGKGHVNMAEVMAALEWERRKNIELLGRVSSLEAKLGGEDATSGLTLEVVDGQGDGQCTSRSSLRTSMRPAGDHKQDGSFSARTSHLPLKPDESLAMVEFSFGDGVDVPVSYETTVNWMCREEVSRADIEVLNDAGSGDDDDDDEEEDDDDNNEAGDSSRRRNCKKGKKDDKAGVTTRRMDSDDSDDEDAGLDAKRDEQRRRGEGRKTPQGKRIYWSKRYGYGPYPVGYRGAGILSSYKKAPKFALTPMEVKRILESGVLALKNAQSHTMRKIIVFSCLCIRHGCEDFYELDINHFKVLQRGEPYKSAKDPGYAHKEHLWNPAYVGHNVWQRLLHEKEHILYSHPSGRTKVFLPNQQNPILCPVHIIDEEKEMRPAGASTPSCLFLCIKYGGRTRNLPQNQYVRQRMGRNKLKSFGPLMCQMALLVHVRTGSFFFKALGITLLFMAGFSDDQVRKETKYRNLDLLRKYYRSDDAAQGEQLFHPYPAFSPQAPRLPATASQAIMVAPIAPTPASTQPSQGSLTPKKPPPLLVRKDPPVLPLVSTRPKVSADRPYRRIPPLPLHLMKAPKRGRKPKNLDKPKQAPLGPPPFGPFPRFPIQGPPIGFPPMPPPPGWRPGTGFPPGAFPFPFPPFPTSPGAGPPPPFFPLPYGFPPFMLPPPPSIAPQESTGQPQDEVGPSDGSGSDSGSSKPAAKLADEGCGKADEEEQEQLVQDSGNGMDSREEDIFDSTMQSIL